jgi:hypothetical protein
MAPRDPRSTARGLLLATLLLVARATAEPLVRNPGFEEDAYTVSPGYARQNGAAITGWTLSGGAGLNPVWRDTGRKAVLDAPFHDNGRVPEGRQIAFIQGPGTLRQTVTGFRLGRRYRVTYRENARVQRRGDEWPTVQVLLGGLVVVSPHEVTPVAATDAVEVPFARVESAWFTPTVDGDLELVFETVQKALTTSILLDHVRIEEEPRP